MGNEGSRINEVVALLEFEVGINAACCHAPAILARRAEAQLLREYGYTAERTSKKIGGLTGAGRIDAIIRICHRRIADIIGKILTNEQVIGIIDPLLGLTIGVSPGIDHIEHRQPAFNRPAGIRKVVFEPVLFEALDFQSINVEFRIDKEHAIGLNALA